MSSSLQQLVGNMSVSDLARAAGLDVHDVVAVVMGVNPKTQTKTKTKTKAAPKRGRAKAAGATARAPRTAAKPNPRGNRDERAAAYTEKVRAAIVNAKAPVSSADIRAKAGGNTSRCGLAIKRLLAAGVITHDGGQTSARRYAAA